jgi:two-component system, cell cycle response regulator
LIFLEFLKKKPVSVAITKINRRGKNFEALNLGSYQADRFANTMATDLIEHLASVVSICLVNKIILTFSNATSFSKRYQLSMKSCRSAQSINLE